MYAPLRWWWWGGSSSDRFLHHSQAVVPGSGAWQLYLAVVKRDEYCPCREVARYLIGLPHEVEWRMPHAR